MTPIIKHIGTKMIVLTRHHFAFITMQACWSIFPANRWFGWNIGGAGSWCIVFLHVGFSRTPS